MEATSTMRQQDKLAVHETLQNYIEGWHTGDADRMSAALDPDLAKRMYIRSGENKGYYFMDAGMLIGNTAKGGYSNVPRKDARMDITIYDVFEGMATARIDAHDFVDFLHLQKVNDQWKIINVLWKDRDPT